MDLKLRCSASGCDCTNFAAATAKDSLRVCDGCAHSWMTHLLEKLLTSRDDALSIFDVCSLALYGTHALPIRLKIVIERLLATLQSDEVDKILRSFGWTPQDLARGYMIQDPRGGLLAKWTMPPREEEILILQQFLRFQATRALSFALLRDDFPLMSPGMTGLPTNTNFSSLFHPSLNLLNFPSNHATTPTPTSQPSLLTTPPNNNNPLHNPTTTNNGSSSGSNNSSSLLSPKSPINHNNNINTSLPGALFSLSNSHLLGGLGAMPHFPAVSLANFTSSQQTPNNNHSNSAGQNNNGKSHHHHQNDRGERGATSGTSSGDRMSRARNSRRNTNSSALNLSVQSDSDEEENNIINPQNMNLSERKQMNEVVDLSSSNGIGNLTKSSKRSCHTNSTGSSTTNTDHHQHGHSERDRDRERLINTLNSLNPHHPMNHLVKSEPLENHRERGGDKERDNSHGHFKGNNNNPLGMSNELLNNLNNMHKSVDLMAAAAAAAAAAAVSNNGQSPGHGGHGQGQHGQGQGQTQGQHNRKTMQPLKRERGWNPVPMAAQLVNPASSMTAQGKRRVQCSVCFKTFCDKGALKIHFSAVHLREMHKCTVAGCNMMFSSRRSRNRHSANPNPKLHSPHLRRKISPHDGRSSQPLINLNTPMLFPGPGIRFPPFLPGMGLPQNGGMNMSMDSGKDGDKSSDDDTMDLKHLVNSDMMMDPDASNSEASFSSEEANEEFLEPKSSPSNGGGGGGGSKKDGARKRKLTNPVRLSNVADDSNDEFCCYDDGTVVSHEDDDIEEEDRKDKEMLNPSPLNGHPSPPTQIVDEYKRRKSVGSENANNEEKVQERRISEEEKSLKEEPNHLGKLEALPIFSAASPHNSDSSMKSDPDDEENNRSTGSPNSIGDIPIDPENPRRCLVCGKLFQNHFGVKTHYQNVHLKLMHKCTVDGCNAAFPSKRSRDRHSSNLNLHRKLLSTSDDPDNSDGDGFSNDSFKDVVDKRERELPLTPDMSPAPPITNSGIIGTSLNNFFNPYLFHNGGNNANAAAALLGLPNQTLSPPMGNPPPWNPFLPFNLFPTVFQAEIASGFKENAPSIVDCNFCSKSFVEGPSFIHHLESSHSEDLFRCKCCTCVFDSRKKLESHSKACVV